MRHLVRLRERQASAGRRKVAASRRISRQPQPWIAATSRSAREVAANPWLMLASRQISRQPQPWIAATSWSARVVAANPWNRRDISVGLGNRIDAKFYFPEQQLGKQKVAATP